MSVYYLPLVWESFRQLFLGSTSSQVRIVMHPALAPHVIPRHANFSRVQLTFSNPQLRSSQKPTSEPQNTKLFVTDSDGRKLNLPRAS